MRCMFYSASSFNGDISKWDVSRVTNMKHMFASASSFNGDISNWDVSSVKDMTDMFSSAKEFNGDISKWDVLRVTSMENMFFHAASFNRKLCGAGWVNSKASKKNMFTGSSGSISRAVCTTTTAFSSKPELKDAVDACLKLPPKDKGPHGPMAEWDVSSVTDMSGVFANADSFNGDMSKWDVSGVTSMSRMFMRATSFNGDLSHWDVSSVTDMTFMFMHATSFNGDLSKWDVSRVSDMTGMFRQAKVFNRDLSEWDVSSVTGMDDMFLNAVSFNQKLCGADWFRSKASKLDMFEGSPGSISRTVCTSAHTPVTSQAPHQRRPISERELIARTPISTAVSTPVITSTIDRSITCPICGTFRKSGRFSCCAPGGAWFKNCGGLGIKKFDHRWSEGLKACKRKFKANNM